MLFLTGTGTLGLIIRKKSGDTLYGISNNHVGAQESTTANPTAKKGDPWDPTRRHMGMAKLRKDTIVTLDEWTDMIPSGMGRKIIMTIL